MKIMKIWIQKHGRVVGGVCGISTAIASWFGLKLVGAVFALFAIVLFVLAGRLEK